MNISFIGAGNVASSLGNLFEKAGHTVKYGTQNPNEYQLSVADAISFGEVVCFAIPFSAMTEVLTANKEHLKGKIVVDITNAINIADWSPLFLGEDSGGEQTARLLPESRVVKAFNTIFADVMKPEKQSFDGQKLTAFVASDDLDAANVIKQLTDEIGFSGLIVGGIKNARHIEAIAHLNISIALAGGGTDAGFTYFQRK
ncbi:NAD(P)-binding domain-containing protein [Flavobacterium sp.]|uniref:NADPH-dependent F420 reductase n=1 Tax=Flavobacterium sp. TaxID=239 RepID=UPI0026389F55|nr:NAD(P)-binding domain-containing protein [Flavobacterium sp.]